MSASCRQRPDMSHAITDYHRMGWGLGVGLVSLVCLGYQWGLDKYHMVFYVYQWVFGGINCVLMGIKCVLLSIQCVLMGN